jgi:uncharacterized protein YjcR
MRQRALPETAGARHGAPERNANAVTHGEFTREAIAERKFIRDLVRDLRKYAGKIG